MSKSAKTPAKTPATKKGSDKETCDLCAGPFKASEEVLQCEGSCRLYMHRYCAGLARRHYMELKSSSKPFVCLVCTQQLHKAEVMALQAEVASLKNELRDLRTLASSVAAAPPNSETLAATQPNNDELRSLKEDLDQLKEVVSKSYAEVTARGHLSAVTKNHKRYGKGRHNQARSQRDENSSGKDYSRPTTSKERVVGARKIWGTLRTTTSNAVSSTLSKLTSKGNQVQVKRKYKSIQSTNKTARWWFVLRGSEDMLQEIENEWDHVSAQTNWKLEPLLKFSDPVDVHDNPPLQPESNTHSDHQPPSCQEAFLENP